MNERDMAAGRGEAGKKPSAVKQAIGKATAKLRADPDMLEVLEAFASLEPNAIEKCTPQEARQQPTPADAVKKVLENQGRSTDPKQLVPGIRSEDRTIPGAGGEMRARIYTPTEGSGPWPAILYIHGGGWVIADLEVYDGGARGLAKNAQAVVVSIDYRQAPEHKFPAAWDDSLAAYFWLTENADSIGADSQRLAIAGESAGGCMAVATAIAARDQRLPQPKHVLAVYPVAQTSLNTPSYIENALAQPLNRAMVPWFMQHLLNSDEEKKDPRLCLVEADLAGLPPVTIVNAMLDPLRSDGAMLETALKKAGVQVERKDYHGVAHEFFGMAAVVEKAREAQAFAGARLRASLSGPTLH